LMASFISTKAAPHIAATESRAIGANLKRIFIREIS
jgi:hypothetical protein